MLAGGRSSHRCCAPVQDKARRAGGNLFSDQEGDAVNRQSLSEATRSHQSAPKAAQGLNQPTLDQRALWGLKRNSDQMRISVISCAYDGHMETNHITSEVTLADCPEDGGKYAIYCEHTNAAGELIGTSVVQDTNKRRLAQWAKHSSEWCCFCQEEEQ